MITIRLNGRERPTSSTTLGELLAELRLGLPWVIVELNGTGVNREAVAATPLHQGDQLEIVKAVAGG
ncbi:MAG: sulfur carrier protein ThiS [Planctomycetota bacterium]